MRIAESPIELFLKAFVVGAGLTLGSAAGLIVLVMGLAALGYEPRPITNSLENWDQ